MAIEDWIDAVVGVAGSVASHKASGFVRAYRVAGKAEIPESLNDYPCAIVYPESVTVDLAMGKELWRGVAMFYLFPDSKKSNLPEVTRYFTRIREVFAIENNWTLGELVDHFRFTPDGPSIELVTASYGDEVERHALRVSWEVKAGF
jgi:hypothetical protein